MKMSNGEGILADLMYYDEDYTDNVCIDFLKQFKKVEFEGADEYSIVLANVVLKCTDYIINYTDERFEWFVEPSDRFVRVESLPYDKEVGNHFYIDWYQGFHGDMYAKAMRDIMIEAGMKGVRLQRVE